MLTFFLKPGGALHVIDIKAEDDGRELFPDTHHGLVPHRHGIVPAELRTTFEGAGLRDFALEEVAREVLPHNLGGHPTAWFMARGIKGSQ